MLSGRAKWQPKCVTLTFDDSLKCTTDVAFPILEHMGMTATVFVTTAAIETSRPYWWLRLDYAWHKARRARAQITLAGESLVLIPGDLDSLVRLKSVLRRTPSDLQERAVDAVAAQLNAILEDVLAQYPFAQIMSWEDLRKARARGFSVGSHTVTHANLAIILIVQARYEIGGSKKAIEQELAVECRYFCYPYGAHNELVAALTAESGYEAAVTTVRPGRNKPGHSPFVLNRYSAPAIPGKLAFIMSGFPDALRPFGDTGQI